MTEVTGAIRSMKQGLLWPVDYRGCHCFSSRLLTQKLYWHFICNLATYTVRVYIVLLQLCFHSAEDTFLSAIINYTNSSTVHFKLSPTYVLYMACRYVLSPSYRPDMSPSERTHKVIAIVNKMVSMMEGVIQVSNTTRSNVFLCALISNIIWLIVIILICSAAIILSSLCQNVVVANFDTCLWNIRMMHDLLQFSIFALFLQSTTLVVVVR